MFALDDTVACKQQEKYRHTVVGIQQKVVARTSFGEREFPTAMA
jgi:hypothetical protein